MFCSVFERIPLDFFKDEKFWEAAENYVRPLLTKFHSCRLPIVQATVVFVLKFFSLGLWSFSCGGGYNDRERAGLHDFPVPPDQATSNEA
ncbi:hypothetical protein Scep_027531 [Stephania cephalantha]|uniref:Uncharacterized protein n=1 Tax=Stephania cephalantha TaxID=152367 RepID=A0AAP0EGJ7_9MAGN